MAGLIKRTLRKLLDHELGVVGEEIAAAEHALTQLDERVQSLQRRFDLLQQRVGMRLKRATRERDQEEPDEGERFTDEEKEIIRQLRSQGGGSWPGY